VRSTYSCVTSSLDTLSLCTRIADDRIDASAVVSRPLGTRSVSLPRNTSFSRHVLDALT
jgi:hypothetical protein